MPLDGTDLFDNHPVAKLGAVERVLATEFRIDAYQETYFVIESFEQLFHETHRPFAPLYAQLQNQAPYAANAVVPSDHLIHRGTGIRG